MTCLYDPPDGTYTDRIPKGTTALRTYLKLHFGFTRTEVIRDQSRCRATDSEHCTCRAIDAFTTTELGNELFDWAVANAERLGIQSAIYRDRQWGFGKCFIRPRTKHDHWDHVHIGLTEWASQNLTLAMIEGDEMTDEDWTKLRTIVAEEVQKGLTELIISTTPKKQTVKSFLFEIRSYVGKIKDKVGA